jgi:hypothetical protein
MPSWRGAQLKDTGKFYLYLYLFDLSAHLLHLKGYCCRATHTAQSEIIFPFILLQMRME